MAKTPFRTPMNLNDRAFGIKEEVGRMQLPFGLFGIKLSQSTIGAPEFRPTSLDNAFPTSHIQERPLSIVLGLCPSPTGMEMDYSNYFCTERRDTRPFPRI